MAEAQNVGHESNLVSRWIRQRLQSAPVPIPANEFALDEKERGPQYVFNLERGGDRLTKTGGYRVWAEDYWLIKVVTQGTSTDETARRADEIERLILGKAPMFGPNGIYIISVTRDSPVRYFEQGTTGPSFHHRGAVFKIRSRIV